MPRLPRASLLQFPFTRREASYRARMWPFSPRGEWFSHFVVPTAGHGVWVRYRVPLGPKSDPLFEVGRLRCARTSMTGLFPLRGSWLPLRPSLVVFTLDCDFPALPCELPVAWKMSRILTRSSSATLFANVINFSTDFSTGVLYRRIWTCSGGGSHDSSSAQVEPGSVWCMSAANEGW